MPIEVTAATPEDVAAEFTEDVLFTPKGTLTLEAETLAGFVGGIDFDAMFDDPEVRQFVETGPVLVSESEDGRLVCDMTGDVLNEDNAEGVMVVEYIDGEIAAEFIDEADLAAMLDYYVKNELPNETLEDRTVRQQFADILEGDPGDDDDEDGDDDGDGVTEAKRPVPFKKGNFRSGPMTKVSGASKGPKRKIHNQRVRMMVAMLKKGAIVRVPKGTGYKKGDYKYGGEKSGTAAGKKAYELAAKANHKAAGKIAKNVDPGRRKVVGVIFKNIGKSMPKNWIPPERRGKGGKTKVAKKVGVKTGAAKVAAVGKAKSLFGKKAGGAKGKQADVAHDTGAVSNVFEGAGMAAAMMGVSKRNARPVTEQTEKRA